MRHALSMVRYGGNPAATVYDSLGSDFFLALAPGWLNLGLWEGDGSDPHEAPDAVRRLVQTIARVAARGRRRARRRERARRAGPPDRPGGRGAQPDRREHHALPARRRRAAARRSRARCAVNGDATRLPFAPASFDGVISVEAAFHFPSRARFFAEAYRVLRPGGVLTMSDIPIRRMPRTPAEIVAGVDSAAGVGPRPARRRHDRRDRRPRARRRLRRRAGRARR